MSEPSPSARPLLSERFQLLEVAGSGGMATVYRAIDQRSGERVALKLLHASGEGVSSQRFGREVEVLASLVHPRVVRYIAHGLSAEGHPYLAMEWLEGEDLSKRLARQGLTPRESVELVGHTASALAVAHQRGIVHRDIKPSNLFLRGGEVDGLVVLDFGIARRTLERSVNVHTQTGDVLGTPHYMAPEQARGARDLGPSVDVFALGCVLFQCLTGRTPFMADHLVGVLAKILVEDPPPLRSLRPEMPEALESLLARMLAKDPARRPRDAGELVALLEPLASLPHLAAAPRIADEGSTFSDTEQQLVSVIVASGIGVSGPTALDETGVVGQPVGAAELRKLVERHDAEVEWLADGSIVATVRPDERRVATDQAIGAARLALALHHRWPEASMALTTGRGQVRDRLPVGDAIDRAVRLLQQHTGSSEAPTEGVLVDDLTAALLDQRFDLTLVPGGTRLLRSEQGGADDLRLLLGKPTPCVGREQELGALDTALAACLDDGPSQALLITAPPGGGKSRLRHEFLRRLAARGEVTVVLGRADVRSQGSPYGLVRSAIQQATGLREGDLPEQQQRALEAQAAGAGVDDPRRVAEFLGELCGVPFPDADRTRLVRARQEPRIMGEEVAQAWLDLLAASSRRQPVVIVLEDIHWADTLSLRLVERALRELEEHPLLVVALARPEVHELMPDLWPGRVTKIPLRGLSKKACERLALEILGKDTPAATLARLVQQAAGNALFLEELIRAVAGGKGDEMPGSVLAMLQSRLARLSAEERRVLRAGSVFGETFRRSGAAALLGRDPGSSPLDACLEHLVTAEMIERSRDDGGRDDQGFSFRHAMMRDAAYGLLSDSDRVSGHLRAAQYLEDAGDTEPLALLEHYRRAGALARTVPLHVRAGQGANRVGGLPEARRHFADAYAVLASLPADPAHDRSQVDVLLAQVQMGMMSDSPERNLERMAEARALLGSLPADQVTPDDERREIRIEFLCGRIHHYLGQAAEALAHCQRALPLAQHLGDAALETLTTQTVGVVLYLQGKATEARPLLQRGLEHLEHIEGEYERLRVLGNQAMVLVMSGHYHEGMALHAQAVARAHEVKLPSALSVALSMKSFSQRLCGDTDTLLETAQIAVEQTEKGAERMLHYVALSLLGWGHGLRGDRAMAVSLRDRARALAEQLGGRVFFADWFVGADAEIALRAGDAAEALAIASTAPTFRSLDLRLGLGVLEKVWGLALGRLAPAQRDEADAHLTTALDLLDSSGQAMASAQTRLEWSALCRQRGDLDAASRLRDHALAQYESFGCAPLLAHYEQTLGLR